MPAEIVHVYNRVLGQDGLHYLDCHCRDDAGIFTRPLIREVTANVRIKKQKKKVMVFRCLCLRL